MAKEEEELIEAEAQIFKEEEAFQAIKVIQMINKIKIQEELVMATKGEVIAIKDKEDMVILNAIIATNLVILLEIARTSNTRLA